MTDVAQPQLWGERIGYHTSDAAKARLRRRYAAETRFKYYGVAAIVLGVGLLAVLLWSIVSVSYTAFVQTHVRLDVYLDPAQIAPDGNREAEALRQADYGDLVNDSLYRMFPDAEASPERRALRELVSSAAEFEVRAFVLSRPESIGETVAFTVPLASNFDQAYKGNTPRDVDERRRRVSDQQYAWLDALEATGRLSTPFNWALFTNADSRQPEQAGLAAALLGSLYTILVCLAISVPLGIGAAIYLEEFAPKNRLTDIVEININNLAAVPSIIFGLLGLAVFIQVFGLPRSVPLVGGLVLALIVLPTIIIAARVSLKAVPPSIREAALGMGASKLQTISHHILPLAMPGILTGTIIGMAHALGETAPLLMIGMNAFVLEAPDSLLSPSTALPSQIYLWADSSERGFVERTSAAIMVLLAFLILMNAVAVFLRRRFERRW